MSSLSPLLQQMQGLSEADKRLGEVIAEKLHYEKFSELLHESSDAPAFVDASFTRKSLTHKELSRFIREDFHLPGVPMGARVCVCLPNIPEMGTCLTSLLSTQRVVFPVNPAMTAVEMEWEIRNTGCVAVVTLDPTHSSSSASVLTAASSLQLPVYALQPSAEITGLFLLAPLPNTLSIVDFSDSSEILTQMQTKTGTGTETDDPPPPPQTCTGARGSLALLLYTSGTSGHKKLVPYSLGMLVCGVACIISSWQLQDSDTCLNMMPLFHIGGIMRNLLSPLLSGGASLICNGFDPILFWDILGNCRVTWYYAAPTMHHAILQESLSRHSSSALPPTESIRFVANAAGGLLPVLAKNLKQTFGATILTSYGMTECMPISTPPFSYDLDPIGTSGTAAGPRICIVTDDLEAVGAGEEVSELLPGQVGNILVRGGPCFAGYEVPAAGVGCGQEECFFTVGGEAGWFSTGDCGYLNGEGYLFITGRSKEIINRGGETISPYEIEEAIIQHPQVKDVLAFAAPHDTLQETVGVVVTTPSGSPRLDLPSLWDFLGTQQQLHRSKWPSVVVFMNALPRNAANKLLRVKLGHRLGLEPVQDQSFSPLERVFEGECPKQGTSLTVPIPITSLKLHIQAEVEHTTVCFIQRIGGVASVSVHVIDSPLRKDTIVAFVTPATVDTDRIIKLCREGLHRYLCPILVQARSSIEGPTPLSPQDVSSRVVALIQEEARATAVVPSTPLEREVEGVWREELELEPEGIVSKEASFFALGGDSLRAGRLVGVARKKFEVPLTVADLFSFPTIEKFALRVAALQTIKTAGEDSSFRDFDSDDMEDLEIESHLLSGQMSVLLPGHNGKVGPATSPSSGDNCSSSSGSGSNSGVSSSPPGMIQNTSSLEDCDDLEQPNYDFRMKYSNTNFTTLLTQLLPLGVFFPLRRLLVWFVIAWSWIFFMSRGIHRFPALLLAMLVTTLVRGLALPLLGVVCKWVIIGRYQAGRYPLFGAMYLKWWVVEQLLRILGRGFFGDERVPLLGDALIRWYYIMMGAQIGRNTVIHASAKLGQPDLLIVGDDVYIDESTIRPFALEEGHMILLPIVIGDHCSVGVKSIIAPGAIVASNTHLGPLSSSHEISDANIKNKQYCRPTFPKPPLYLVLLLGYPLLVMVALVSAVPWIMGIKLMLTDAQTNGWYDKDLSTLYDVFTWWLKPQRLAYYFCLRIIQKVAVPPVKMAVIIFIKWTVIGKFTPVDSAEERAQPNYCFKYWLMSELLPGGDLCGVTKLIGAHYELVSVIYRALGASVGERVYWPGTGIDIVEFDLLDIGDDVIFGSRSIFLPSSAQRAGVITVAEGCMVADRCVLLPGATMQRACVLGSGGLAREEFRGGVGSMWVGSKEGGTTMVQPEDDSYLLRDVKSPFGKAFYENGADYCVFPLWFIVLYNSVWQALCVCYRNSALMLAMLLAYQSGEASFLRFFRKSISLYLPLNLAMVVFALTFDVTSKWVILGRRESGLHSWDRSSYCQRWQLYLTMQELRRGQLPKNGILDFIAGSQYLVWYFQALGCSIGKDVCLFPNGGDPMMTEPDLVHIGQGSCIDDAYLISHINTRGVFKLNRIHVGSYCVLKTNSRLLSGSAMEDNSILLEHTLVLSGEEVERKSVPQGWPISTHLPLEEHRIGLLKMLSTQNLDLTALFLSTNSISDLKSLKRREANKKKRGKGGYDLLSCDSSHHPV